MQGDPKRTIFHWLALGLWGVRVESVRVGVGFARLFGYQHVGIPNAKL